MSSLFSSLANKAQTALNASPLGAALQQHGRSDRPTGNEAAGQGGLGSKSRALGSLQHQFRTLQNQYGSATPTQKLVTAEKGAAIDLEGLSANLKTLSRELYLWGQNDFADIADVTDRLAFLNFVCGSLASQTAASVDAARSPFKALRDAETNLTPRRNIRSGIEMQIKRLEQENLRGSERRIAELKIQLQRAEEGDKDLENNYEIVKRKSLRESEQQKWAALREFGEKIVLLAQASTAVLGALPPVPPTPSNPYEGTDTTAAARATVQKALDEYKPGAVTFPFKPHATDLTRSDSRSFRESHANELSLMENQTEHTTTMYLTPPHMSSPLPDVASPGNEPISVAPDFVPTGTVPHSPPLNPGSLNNTPTVLPPSNLTTGPPLQTPLQEDAPPAPTPVPTVADTGVPLVAGNRGPGPARGSIHDLKPANHPPTYDLNTQYRDESADVYGVSVSDGKRPDVGPPDAPPPVEAQGPQPKFESADDEKRRLEREERERVLRGGGGSSDQNENDGGPPPYMDF